MQNFVDIKASRSLKESRDYINNNFESTIGDFSGTNFPTVSLILGMKCYRTDLNKTYRLTALNPSIWTEIEDLNEVTVTLTALVDKLNSYVEKAKPNFDVPVTAPKFTGELDGNASTASLLKKPILLKFGGAVTANDTIITGGEDLVVSIDKIDASALNGKANIDVTGNVTGISDKALRDGKDRNIADSIDNLTSSIRNTYNVLTDRIDAVVGVMNKPGVITISYSGDEEVPDDSSIGHHTDAFYSINCECKVGVTFSCDNGFISGSRWHNKKTWSGTVTITASNGYGSSSQSFVITGVVPPDCSSSGEGG